MAGSQIRKKTVHGVFGWTQGVGVLSQLILRYDGIGTVGLGGIDFSLETAFLVGLRSVDELNAFEVAINVTDTAMALTSPRKVRITNRCREE